MQRRLKGDTGNRVIELLPDPADIGPLPLERTLLTPRHVCAALRICPRTLANWTATRRGRRPRLSFVKVGKTKRFVAADVVQFVEQLKVRAA